MIKEQNKLKKQEEHPTILVTPETNLSATSIFCYRGLKNIPDKNHIDYDKFTTLQESKVK